MMIPTKALPEIALLARLLLVSALSLCNVRLTLAPRSCAIIWSSKTSRASPATSFKGRVLGTSTYWNNEHTKIYTEVRLQISGTFKGRGRDWSDGDHHSARRRRRTASCSTSLGRPEFKEGEESVLFTTRGNRSDFVVVGLKQGQMHVEGNEVVRDLSGITFVERESAGRTLQTVQPKRTRFALDELRRRVSNTR